MKIRLSFNEHTNQVYVFWLTKDGGESLHSILIPGDSLEITLLDWVTAIKYGTKIQPDNSTKRRFQMPNPVQKLYTIEELRNNYPAFGDAPTHLSTWDVARLLAYIEWRGYNDGGSCCPCCDAPETSHFPADKAGQHKSDCLLNKLLRESWKEHPGRLDQSFLHSDNK